MFLSAGFGFFHKVFKERPSVSIISQFKLLQGCRDKKQKDMIDRFIRHFKVYPISTSISKTAWQIFQTQYFSAHLGIPDSFIAATALINDSKLLTRNIKHYEKIPSLKVERPYP